jgi:hypothetical protein
MGWLWVPHVLVTILQFTTAHLFLFYHRHIDDALIIQQASPNGFANFVIAINDFGMPNAWLEWEAAPPGREVDFLDLHIWLDPTGLISTTLFQKSMHLLMYRPPPSAQPSSIIYSLIYGTLHTAPCPSNPPGISSNGFNNKDTP